MCIAYTCFCYQPSLLIDSSFQMNGKLLQFHYNVFRRFLCSSSVATSDLVVPMVNGNLLAIHRSPLYTFKCIKWKCFHFYYMTSCARDICHSNEYTFHNIFRSIFCLDLPIITQYEHTPRHRTNFISLKQIFSTFMAT